MDGIIPLWKERGMTSHDCVNALRKLLKTRRVGHTGTLDPNVSGVLPICVNKATKMANWITDKEKVYQGEITLGFQTKTEDLDGEIIHQTPVKEAVDGQLIQKAMDSMLGTITQVPPMYSAVKVNGRKLYDYARHGEKVDRPKRLVNVYEFDLLKPCRYDQDQQVQSFNFRVRCGKGTYVRTLASDLGESVGYAATMTDLTRIASTPFTQSQCFTLSEIEDQISQGKNDFIFPIDFLIQDLAHIEISGKLEKLVRNGAVLNKNNLAEEYRDQLPVAFYGQQGLMAIYGQHPSDEEQMKPLKMLI